MRIINGRQPEGPGSKRPRGDAPLSALLGVGCGGVGTTLIGALLNGYGGLALATFGLLATLVPAGIFFSRALRAWLPPH